MALNCEKKLSCFQSCRTDVQRRVKLFKGRFRKQTGREDV